MAFNSKSFKKVYHISEPHPGPEGLVTQKLNEALTESARLEREVQALRATVNTHTRTITGLTVRLTEERLNTSVLREHITACTDWMRKRQRTADSD